GAAENNFQIGPLAERIARAVADRTGKEIEIAWYGHADVRSYRLNFDKIESKLGWHASWTVENGVNEIVDHLESGYLDKTPQTITLEWYRDLEYWYKVIKEVEKYGGILDIREE
ncbi:MAG TPA: SDR family NAD-dependent epimerase/dehydratase, partial [candidate division Zixibacteria bacterium]|nr:SDR family NAD-dependent epimerase/dehydratase [candidate division Zixibacteria bacterium]